MVSPFCIPCQKQGVPWKTFPTENRSGGCPLFVGRQGKFAGWQNFSPEFAPGTFLGALLFTAPLAAHEPESDLKSRLPTSMLKRQASPGETTAVRGAGRPSPPAPSRRFPRGRRAVPPGGSRATRSRRNSRILDARPSRVLPGAKNRQAEADRQVFENLDVSFHRLAAHLPFARHVAQVQHRALGKTHRLPKPGERADVPHHSFHLELPPAGKARCRHRAPSPARARPSRTNPAGLPDRLHLVVLPDERVRRHDSEPVSRRRGHDHPIRWIVVMLWEKRCAASYARIDRDLAQAVLATGSLKPLRGSRASELEFPWREFNADLPRTDCGNKKLIRLISQRRYRRPAELSRRTGEPENHAGIQQDHRAASGHSSSLKGSIGS